MIRWNLTAWKRWVHPPSIIAAEGFDRAKTLFSGKLIRASSNNNLLRDILVRFQWVLHIYIVGCQNRCKKTRECSSHWMTLGRMLALPSSDLTSKLNAWMLLQRAANHWIMQEYDTVITMITLLWQSQQSLFTLAPSCQHGPQQHDGLIREMRLP